MDFHFLNFLKRKLSEHVRERKRTPLVSRNNKISTNATPRSLSWNVPKINTAATWLGAPPLPFGRRGRKSRLRRICLQNCKKPGGFTSFFFLWTNTTDLKSCHNRARSGCSPFVAAAQRRDLSVRTAPSPTSAPQSLMEASTPVQYTRGWSG